MRSNKRTLVGVLMLLAASGLGIWGSVASPQGGVAEASLLSSSLDSGVQFGEASPLGQSDGVWRESVVTAPNGQSPRTGPASIFQPLIDPTFGDNYRANIDTQGPPNLAQQEPSIAVNPTNPLNVVAMAKDERGGSNTKQTWIYTSTDGGVTWINQIFPFSPAATSFSSDPVVNFSDDGICYVTSLPYGSGSGAGIQVARSTDGGITFFPGVHLPGTNASTDKEWTWIDNTPTSPFYHRIYTAWMDFGTGSGWRLNYSSDRGVTFSTASGFTNGNQFPMPVALPNGDVLVSYLVGVGVGYRRSTDGGVTFGTVQNISSITSPQCPPDNSGCGIWRFNEIPVNSVNRTNGTMVVVWADGRASPNNTATVYFTRSTDNGVTWSPAAILAPPGVANTYQVEPWVEADELGNFHAIWYDDRANPATSIFHIYYSQSTDNGATWSTATRISTATTDLRIGIPSSYSLAAGDYINVTASHGNVYGVWTDTRSGTGEDIYVVRGTYGGTPTPTVTGTPPSATPTSTQAVPTATSTRTNTSTSIPTATTTNTTLPNPTSTATRTSTTIPTIAPSSTATTQAGSPIPTIAPSSTATTQVASPTVGASSTQTATPVASVTSTVCAITFSDVPADNAFYTYIRCLACRGIISGYDDGTFRPGNDITRGQIAKIVSNAAGFSDDPGPQVYEDVPVGSPFYDWVNRLSNLGFMGGYECGLVPEEPCTPPNNYPYFRPNASATRGQLSKIVSNAAGLSDTPTGTFYTDVPEGHPFYLWIMRLTTLGVMSGYDCGGPSEPCDSENRPYFRPFNNVTRGQASKIVANTFLPGCETPARP